MRRRRSRLISRPNQQGRVRRVEVSGAPVEARQVNGHLVVPAAALRQGDNRLTIDFDAGDAPLNRNDDFLYTHLRAGARARRRSRASTSRI